MRFVGEFDEQILAANDIPYFICRLSLPAMEVIAPMISDLIFVLQSARPWIQKPI